MKLRIKEVAEKQGIANAKQLAKLTGLSVTSCYQLWNATAKAISFDSLNTLCNVLKANPSLLLDYTPDAALSSGEPSPARSRTARRSPPAPAGKGKSRKGAAQARRTNTDSFR